LLTGSPFREVDVIILASLAGFGALFGLQSGRRVRLYSQTLWIGWQVYPGGPRVPLSAITATGVLRGRELRRVRSRITMPRSKSEPLLLGGAIPGLGQALLGGYLIATRPIRRGNCCAPGQGPAVYLVTPDLDTPLWLIGTRHPEQLRAAIDDARAKLPTPPQTAEPADTGGWLPPPREH